ncbi:hypothetical protein [Spirillospora sp. CA-128828]|uniref:hypothetical protein n=1 Tax=Spirillospora sp. CA-128828 TaxID=3240033 RepID=UPI003D8AD79C
MDAAVKQTRTDDFPSTNNMCARRTHVNTATGIPAAQDEQPSPLTADSGSVKITTGWNGCLRGCGHRAGIPGGVEPFLIEVDRRAFQASLS